MEKPNILLITTDQQRFDTINALGNKHIYTPHLNWLVDQGVTFTKCYADNPICIASRATIITGKRGSSNGLIRENYDGHLPLNTNKTLPGLLTQNGYQTRAQGKMHFHPMRCNNGFEHMELSMDYYRDCKYNNNCSPKEHGVGECEIEPVISTVHENDSITHWTVRRSIDFLETRDSTRPFFLFTSFTKPHPPFDPCFHYWSLYQGKDVPDPVLGDWSQNVKDIPQGFLLPTYWSSNAFRFTPEQLKDVKRAYYACITQIDYSLGLLFARLREMDLLKNTWIIFTSDHGDMMGDHHMGQKSVLLEGSAHIPLIIRAPDGYDNHLEMTNVKCQSVVTLADIMPTILEIAGINSHDVYDGKSLLEIAKTGEQRTFYGNFSNKFLAVMENGFKYLWTYKGGRELLFNLNVDPYEQQDLSKVEKYKPVLDNLKEKMIVDLIKNENPLIKNNSLTFFVDDIEGCPKREHWPGFLSKSVETDVLH